MSVEAMLASNRKEERPRIDVSERRHWLAVLDRPLERFDHAFGLDVQRDTRIAAVAVGKQDG